MAQENIQSVAEYVKLHEQKAEIESDLKAVKEKIKEMEDGVLDFMQENGIQSVKSGTKNVYIHRSIFASLIDKQAAHAAFKEHGYGDLVEDRVMPQRLSAFVREEMARGESEGQTIDIDSGNLASQLPLPAEIKDQINVTERFSVRVRKA